MRPSGHSHRGRLSQGRRRRRRLLQEDAGAVVFPGRQSDPALRQRAVAPRRRDDRRQAISERVLRHESLAATLTAAGVDTLDHHRTDDLGMRARDLRRQHEFAASSRSSAREGVGDRDPRPHEANLYDMNAKYADVVPEARVAEYFRSRAHWRSSRRPIAKHLKARERPMRTLVGICMGALIAALAGPAAADGVSRLEGLDREIFQASRLSRRRGPPSTPRPA